MIIIVDEAGMEAVQGLCDMALKTGGIRNMNAISQIMGSITVTPTAPAPLEEVLKEDSELKEVTE